MPHPDLRREVDYIDRAMKEEAASWGQTVTWYELLPTSVEDEDSDDPGSTFDDDLYDEGGSQLGSGTSRRWGIGKKVTVHNAMLMEGIEQYSDTGTYMVDRLSFSVNYNALQRYGVTVAEDPGAHNGDRIEYHGRIFRVTQFDTQGRIGGFGPTMVTVVAHQVKDDERVNDAEEWHD